MKHTGAVTSVASTFVIAAGVILGGQALTRQKSLQQVAADTRAATVVVNIDSSPGQLQETGSGFFINDRGDIMTAHHVASKDDKYIQVVFADGSKHKGTVVWQSVKDDISVVHVDGVKNHPFLKFGDSAKLKDGDPLVVVGNPLNIGAGSGGTTVTFGHVSNPLTDLAGISAITGGEFPSSPNKYVITDASVNPGNSGGPVVNAEGKVIGLADMAFSASDLGGGPNDSVGINVLVPSNVMKGDLVAFQKSLDKLDFLRPTRVRVTMGDVPAYVPMG